MRMRWMGSLAVMLLATACNRNVENAPDAGTQAESPGTSQLARPDRGRPTGDGVTQQQLADGQPTIKVANWEETQQLVAQNQGQVVILDLWASW